MKDLKEIEKEIKTGDVVCIRGDKMKRRNGESIYHNDQLIDGKYVKNTINGGILTLSIEAINSKALNRTVALAGGTWRDVNCYDVIFRNMRIS